MRRLPPGYKSHDLRGRKFGRLVAIEPTPDRAFGQIIWHCECECGSFSKVPSSRLLSGQTKSCGCLYNDLRPPLAVKNFSAGQSRRGKRWRGSRTSAPGFLSQTRMPGELSPSQESEIEASRRKRGLCPKDGFPLDLVSMGPDFALLRCRHCGLEVSAEKQSKLYRIARDIKSLAA